VKLTLIVAVADNGVIGRENGLPWRLPEDLKRFKALTMGKPIIMGRKTFDSIGKPLPGRVNIVISRQANLALPGCLVTDSLHTAVLAAGNVDEVMVIGGSEIYQQAMALANRIELTEVHAVIDGDARLPEFPAQQWRELAREDHATDERHAYAYSFVTLERVNP
jgi:dihydrofolate reductase